MKVAAISYFNNLFSEQPCNVSYDCIPLPFPYLEESETTDLCKEVSEKGVRTGLFGIGGLKAPRLDGYPAIFFQNQWNICKEDLFKLRVDSFRLRMFLAVLNQTLITLVVKVPMAFVPSRQIQDNIVVAQEVLYKFKIMKGMKGCIAWKIYLTKAYDKLQWNFIRSVNDKTCIGSALVNLIMWSITTVQYRVVLNGDYQVNYSKSRVFCSNNVKEGDARCIANACGSPLTKNLGKYLGVLFIPGRVTNETYTDVIEKVQQRPTAWKCDSISLAGRVTLNKVVTLALLVYTM
ncbi:hypothetical protein Dsin_016721 [Dipteronia sinensis]|uniref:Reverse transcriptase n=1 Tax=Dipteronia sinensis TaxID=43782 RepID=A0AAE0E695_9ROSI|nr:hypothetical protein Dsin_016721 [Dipteronia sinensis]